MRVPRKGVARVGSRLFVVYAIASLVPVVVLGLVLYRGYRHDGRDRALGQGRAQAAVIEQMAIAPVLGRRDLRKGLRPAERAGLLDATELAIFSGSVVRLRIRSFAGHVVFSDDGSRTGALPATDPAFRRAAAGGHDVEIVRDPTGGAGEVIRVLQAIVPNASGQATGVLEVYLPYTAIAATVRAQLRRTSVRLAGVLAALYVILALISWSSTRRLRRHAAESAYQALHDPLTGLPNREWFRIRAERAVHGIEAGERGAVVLVDLDRFKEVNDTLGHHVGDELLQIAGRRLAAAVRTDDIVARLGGDEFGLILPGLATAEQALELLGRVRDELSVELTLESVDVSVEASFGVALFPEHGSTLEELLKRADAAMYQGKRGTAGIVVYAADVVPQASDRLIMQGELRRALERDELILHYQPRIDMRTGRTCGVEALLRWSHPLRGLLAPAEFLPAAEQSGLIEPLTAWVLRRALEDHGRWTSAGADWQVSVNVSARNLESPDFTAVVMSLLVETGTAPERLCLEVTESALAGDEALAVGTLDSLAECGVAVSVDDFGMGYASLFRLRTLAVSEVKIDRAFVMELERRKEDRSIVRSIIELAHRVGCTVTAEGVETAATAAWLRSVSCDSAQGYHFARPAPWRELLERFGRPETAFEPTAAMP
jgi:diguanylate cyclase (GGDEF)-like protein